MTFSIAARCDRTGAFGVAVSSSSPAVASRCAFARAGVGAVCSQNVTDPRLGPALLDLMESGHPAPDAVDELTRARWQIQWRQLTAIGGSGPPGSFSGPETLGTYASSRGQSCVAAGNLLADRDVPAAMTRVFDDREQLPLAERLLLAVESAIETGGEQGSVHSAGILVVTDVPWPVTDLRVDWSDNPIAELRRLWELWAPQEHSYRQRALDPDGSPGFGVPGDTRPA